MSEYKRMKKVSFVIPVFRNQGALVKTHEKIFNIFTQTLIDFDYEIIFIDDGSDDGSLAEILAIKEKNPQHVKALSFTRNFGQLAAMLAGFTEATGDAAINISADLQDPAELIPEMVLKWDKGSEIVICYRTDREDSASAKWVSKIAYYLLRIAIPQIPPGGFDYVLMDRKAIDIFNNSPSRNRFFQGDLLWPGYKTEYIPYIRQKRTIGKSQYTFWKKLKNFLDAILDASYLPIRFISFLGVATSFVGFLYMLTILVSWLFNFTPFSGWAPIMVAILIIGGLNMIMLGIIGEYIWRIYDEIRGKPNYVIREKF